MYRQLQRSNTLRYERLTKAEQEKIRHLGYYNKGKANVQKSKELLDKFDYEDIIPTDEQWEAIGVDEYRASQMEKDLEAIHEFAVSEGNTLMLEVSGLKYNWVIHSVHGRKLVSITADVDSLSIDRHHVSDYVPCVAQRVEDIIWP